MAGVLEDYGPAANTLKLPAKARVLPPLEDHGPAGGDGGILGVNVDRSWVKLKSKVAEIPGDVVDSFTGESRTDPAHKDTPELGTSGPDVSPGSAGGLSMMGAYATTVDEEGIANQALKYLQPYSVGGDKKEIPMKKFQDAKGNWGVTFKGKDYLINKPGMSEADLFQGLAQTGLYAPASRAAAAGNSIVKRMLKAGFLMPLTSVGSDVAGRQIGSEMPISWGRAGFAAATGPLFEGVSPVIGRRLHRFGETIRKRVDNYMDTDGTLTAAGKRKARKHGLDPDDVQARIYKNMEEEVPSGLNPDEQRAAAAQSEKYGFEYTEGQRTRDYNKLADEDALTRAPEGDDLRALRERQHQQMAAQEDVMQGRLSESGAPTISTVDEAGDLATQTATRGRERAEAASSGLYDAIGKAEYEPFSLSSFWKKVGADEDINLRGVSSEDTATVATLRELKRLGTEVRKRGPARKPQIGELIQADMTQLGKVRPRTLRMAKVQFSEFEKVRRDIGKKIGKAKNPDDKRTATILKNHFDDFLDDSFNEGFFTGDPGVLAAMKGAREAYKDLKFKFGDPRKKGAVTKIVGNLSSSDPSGRDVVNWLFGKSSFEKSPATSIAVAKHLRDVTFGKNSEEWSQLRQSAWLRISRNNATGKRLTPRALATSIDRATHQQKALLNEIFGDPFVKEMRSFRNAISRLDIPNRNPSGSAAGVARLMKGFGQSIQGMFYGAGRMRMATGDPALGLGLVVLSRIPIFSGGARRAARDAARTTPRRPPSPTAAAAAQAAPYEPFE